MSEFTRILERVEQGDSEAAGELLPLVYAELRRLAAHKMAGEAPGHTLQPTALVHEAWLRLGAGAQPGGQNRAQFFGAAAEAMGNRSSSSGSLNNSGRKAELVAMNSGQGRRIEHEPGKQMGSPLVWRPEWQVSRPDRFNEVVLEKCLRRGHLDICGMAKIKCFSIAGMQLWFYSNDHEPPHFHVKRSGQWEFKVKFLEAADEMFDRVWSTKKTQMSKTDRELLQEMVEKHRFEILQEWEQKVARS